MSRSLQQTLVIASFAIGCLQFSSALAPPALDGLSRRGVFEIAGWASLAVLAPPSLAEESTVEVAASGDAKKLFNEARALESQGNMAAAQRLYSKVTKISPRVRFSFLSFFLSFTLIIGHLIWLTIVLLVYLRME